MYYMFYGILHMCELSKIEMHTYFNFLTNTSIATKSNINKMATHFKRHKYNEFL